MEPTEQIGAADAERVSDLLADLLDPVLETIEKYERADALTVVDMIMLTHNLHKWLLQKVVLEDTPVEYREPLIAMADQTWHEAMEALKEKLT